MPDAQDVEDIRSTLAAQLSDASATDQSPPSESSPDSVEASSDQTVAEKAAADQRARDEKGRFAAGKGQEPVVEGQGKEAVKAAVEGAPATDTAAPTPPPGFSPASKAAWHNGTIPPEVIKDIAKREQEIAKGFASLREYKPLEPYVEMARQSNTTLADALKAYVAAEQHLERDPEGALIMLARNYNVNPDRLMQRLGGAAQSQIPAPNAAQARPAAMPDLAPIISPLQSKIEQLEQMIYGREQSQIENMTEQFFADPANRYAENVADDMAALITSGQAQDLKEAYEKACWLNPDVRAEIMKESRSQEQAAQASRARQIAAQAKTAGRSISGAPATTQVGNGTQGDDLRAMLEAQFAGAARA